MKKEWPKRTKDQSKHNRDNFNRKNRKNRTQQKQGDKEPET